MGSGGLVVGFGVVSFGVVVLVWDRLGSGFVCFYRLVILGHRGWVLELGGWGLGRADFGL